MNPYKQIFSTLKQNNVNAVFRALNKELVLGIANGDMRPKTEDDFPEIIRDIKSRFSDLRGRDTDVDLTEEFLNNHLTGMKFCHNVIDTPSYGVSIDYYAASGETAESHPAKTLILTMLNTEGSSVIHADMVIFKNHECVSDDNIGKIVKHELCHIMLEVMRSVLNVGVWVDPVTSSNLLASEERYTFEEFLCDYLPCEELAGPNGDPVDVFRDVMKRYLTWVASDLYDEYLKAVVDYYNDAERTDEHGREEA